MTTMTSEREAFEKWARGEGYAIAKQDDDSYHGIGIRNAWEGWQARAHLAHVVAYLAEDTGKPMSREIVDLHFPTDEDKAKGRLTPLTRALSGEKAPDRGPGSEYEAGHTAGWAEAAEAITKTVDPAAVAAVAYEAWMDDPGLWRTANGLERRTWTKIAQAVIAYLGGRKPEPKA